MMATKTNPRIINHIDVSDVDRLRMKLANLFPMFEAQLGTFGIEELF